MQSVDGYRILRELGKGGAGAVYLAQRPHEVPVALKLLLQFSSSRAHQRFEREVDALKKLRHPSVVSLRGAGNWQGRPYLVMDYVEGDSLHDLLHQGGPLNPERSTELVRELAAAVQHAHDRGLLHRDLKPANVLLDAEGHAYLGDFGLTREVDPTETRLTRTGGFVGTPGYWSPEQALGAREETSVTTDVFGLGGILYTCLTARPPRPSELALESLQQPIVPPAELRPEVPRWLSDVCMRCLESSPSDRYPTANAVALALQGPPKGTQRSLAPLAVALCLGATAVALLAAAVVSRSSKLNRVPPQGSSPAVAATEPSPPTASEDDSTPPTPGTEAEQVVDEARALAEAGAVEDALALLARQLAAGTQDPNVWAYSGSLKSGLNRFVEADVDLQRALELDPNLAGTWTTYSHVLHKLGKLDEALAATDRAGQLNPTSSDPPFNRGRILQALGRLPEASDAYAQAARLNPQDAGAHANRGITLVSLRRYDEALASFNACLALDPNQVIALEGRGSALLSLGRPADALRDLNHVVTTDPKAPSTTWVNHGVALAQLDRKPEARTSFEQAIRLGDANPQTYVNFGLVCRDLGDVAAARGAFEEALSRLPPGSGRDQVQAYLDGMPPR